MKRAWQILQANLKNSRKVDFYARWAIRLLLFIGVAYLVFFKDVKTVTQFTEPSARHDSLVVIDYRIIEHRRNDSIIKVIKHEEIQRVDSLPDDSLRAYILRTIKR